MDLDDFNTGGISTSSPSTDNEWSGLVLLLPEADGKFGREKIIDDSDSESVVQ